MSALNLLVKVNADGTQTIIPITVVTPSGLVFDQSGNVYLADSLTKSVVKIAPDGAETTVATGLGNLLVADTGSNSILEISPQGTKTPVATGVLAPTALAMARALRQLLDISTRALVQTGNNVLIAGFIVRGTPQADVGQTTVQVRAIGPSLDPAAVPDPLLNPTPELHDSTGAINASNDNWKQTQQAQIQATGLAPTDNRESAIEATLADGSYTAIVRGSGNSTRSRC